MTIEIQNSLIYNYDKNKIKKEHKPLSTSFSQIEVLNDGRILILENYYKFKYEQKSNLYCLNQDIDIDWFLPIQNADIYVGFSTNGNQVFANTWNGFRVGIDVETGKIISMQFTK